MLAKLPRNLRYCKVPDSLNRDQSDAGRNRRRHIPLGSAPSFQKTGKATFEMSAYPILPPDHVCQVAVGSRDLDFELEGECGRNMVPDDEDILGTGCHSFRLEILQAAAQFFRTLERNAFCNCS